MAVTQQATAQQDSTKTDEATKATTKENDVTISADYFVELKSYEAKYNDLMSEYNSMKSKCDSINSVHRKESVELTSLRQQSAEKERRIANLKKDLEVLNKQYINMAANFLFIPYDAYSVTEIAIPAFDAITDPALKEKHRTRYILLKRYKEHIQEMRDFLAEEEKNLEYAGEEQAKDALNKMRQKSFYTAYNNHSDNFKSTYLGKKIITAERLLQAFDGNKHKFNVKGIIAELQACLKTEEDL